ncbi:MAG: alpha-hydroxy-acid oxidizing protein [Burkholderiales bacterium]
MNAFVARNDDHRQYRRPAAAPTTRSRCARTAPISSARAFLYGLGALGRAGVALAIDILRREMDATLALPGCTDVAQLDRACVIGTGARP